MQAVTVGDIATEEAQSYLQHTNSDYLYFHGLAVQIAEALAESVHARGFESWGLLVRSRVIFGYSGSTVSWSRYSFRYPACPNIQDQYKLLGYWGAIALTHG